MQVYSIGLRDGSNSLKSALSQLGYGRTYSMGYAVQYYSHMRDWTRQAAGERAVDFNKFFASWEVSKAHPAMFYPEEMLAAFPRVKVILLQREDDAWFDSYCRYYRAISWLGTRLWFLPRCRAIHRLFSRSTFAFLGEGHEHNRDNVIRARKDLYARVRALVPPEQLLEFNVQQGWAPLCRFLHKPVPEAPFPWTNKKKNAVKKAIGLALTRDLVWAGGAAAILVATVFWPPAVVLLAGEAALWALLFHLRRV